jgi:hypothetical protein
VPSLPYRTNSNSLDAHDALRRQRLRACENELVFLGVDIVGNHVNVIAVSEPLAQDFYQRGFAWANRAADPDAQKVEFGNLNQM